MLSNMPMVSTSTIMPAISHTSSGVRRGASSVEIAVMPTERARSPFAKYVITLEAVPHGLHPTRMIPRANSFGNTNMQVNTHASKGITVYWAKHPIKIFLGRLNTMRKSCNERVKPIPNIITPNIGLIALVSTHKKDDGQHSDTTATARTITPMY